MVKLDLSILRYLSRDDFRVLTAVEMGMKNHDLVSTQLINSLASLKRGDVVKAMQQLHKNKLVYHESKPYDGYRLTYHGYDFLAVKTHSKRENLVSIGNQIGTGKESDVFLGQTADATTVAVKFHRLGRTSFRSIKRNRDYHKGRTHASWLYLSRLAALKEFAYMKVLFENGFPVPTPIDVNRHVIVMEYLKGFTTLYHIYELKHPGRVYNTLMNLLVSLAECGLIHGDFNEFNLMVDENDNVIMIDFPQMVSIDHPNAEYYFNRDVEGVRNFFKKRFGFNGAEYPVLGKDTFRKHDLDKQIQASGFSKEMEEEFDTLAKQNALAQEDPQDEQSSSQEEEQASSSHALDRPSENRIATEPFHKVEMQQAVDDDDDESGDDEDVDVEGVQDKPSAERTPGKLESSEKTQQKSEKLESESSEDDEEDDGPPGESRRERRDRLRKKSEEKRKRKEQEAAKLKPTSTDASPSAEEPIVPEPGEEGLDIDTIRRNRLIRNRVKAQLERKRQQTKVHVRNAFKLQAKRNLAQQTRGWAEDL